MENNIIETMVNEMSHEQRIALAWQLIDYISISIHEFDDELIIKVKNDCLYADDNI
jgi:hypothetical protein